MFHTIFFLFYYISFFVLSPIRFCYIFYNFEVIFLFFGISPLHSSLSPISGVPPLTSGRRLTSGRLASPAFRGASPCLACTSHLWHSSLSPISGVLRHAFTNHLTSVTTCFPLLPGYQNQPRMHISPRKHLLPPPSGVLPYAIRILGIFPCGTISAEQRMRGISREEGDAECRTV